MICREDIAKLWALRDESKALLCAKHDYKTKASGKYLGNKTKITPVKTGRVWCFGIAVILPIKS